MDYLVEYWNMTGGDLNLNKIPGSVKSCRIMGIILRDYFYGE
jgi:hypothetical protein